MKYIVLSLKDSPRRPFITKEFEKLGLEFEFFDGFYGKEFFKDEANIDKYCDRQALKDNPRWLNPGMNACALGHYYIYRKLIKEGHDKAVIFEDDMTLEKNLLPILEGLKKREEKNEVIMLYYRGMPDKKLHFSTQNAAPISKGYQVIEPCELRDSPGTTGAYYITKDACQMLADIILPIRWSPDAWAHFIENGGIASLKIVYPRPIESAGFKSEIDYHESYSSGPVQLLKKILDKVNLPFVNSALRKRRKRLEEEMSVFELVDRPSQIVYKAKQD